MTEQFPDLRGQGLISLDTETCDPELMTKGPGWYKPKSEAYICGVALGTKTGFRKYYPLRHEEGGNIENQDQFWRWLKVQLGSKTPKVGAKLLYDIGFLGQEGIEVNGPLYDIQNAEPLLDENRFSYGLEDIAQRRLGHGKVDEEMDEYLKKFGGKTERQRKGHIWKAHASQVESYAIGDINHPLEIFEQQERELKAQDLWGLFELETSLVPLLYKMRRRGVRVDVDRAQQLYDMLGLEQERVEERISDLTGVTVAPWAAKSIAEAFDAEGLPYNRTAKTNAPSITKALLTSTNHELASLVLRARELDKLRGTFLMGCILESHYNGRVYGEFHQQKSEEGGTVTGRFSSSNPNLQFIPTRTKLGKLIRELFLADVGQTWWKVDYSQIEYRLMAHVAQEMGCPGAVDVVRAYLTNPDIDFHAMLAAMTGLSRSSAKTINFGLAYGEGEEKLAMQLGLTLAKARELLSEYHRRAPFMRPMSEGCMRIADRTGQIDTLFGRVRRFPWGRVKWEDGEKKTYLVPREQIREGQRPSGARRIFTHAALNARIQGSAADIMKKAMDDLHRRVDIMQVLGVPQLTVHDELDGSMPDTREAREAMLELKDVLERTVDLHVPLRVDISTGENWGSVVDLSRDQLGTWRFAA